MCEIGKGNSWDDKKNKEEEGDKVEKEIVKKECGVKRTWTQNWCARLASQNSLFIKNIKPFSSSTHIHWRREIATKSTRDKKQEN